MATWKKVITEANTASTSAVGVVELATTAETTTGTDATRAVTPDGLKDGYQGSTNVTTLGTITAGTWNGSVIAEAYLQNQSGTNTGDEPDASTSVKGIVELATTAEVTTGTDATRAVTPDGLKDGYQGSTNVTTLGTITAGTWNGSVIAEAYLQNQSGTNTGDEPDASTTVKGIVELATTAEVTTGTDATRAVTPDGLKDGYQGSTNVTTLGTITAGTWNGSVIAEAYLQNQSGTNTGDEPDASTSVKGIVELATTAEVTTGTDATRAVTPDGLKDGYQGSSNVTTLGTISTGTWNGTAVGVAYGGTGLSSVAKGSLIHTTADDTFAALSGGVGDDGKVVAYNETDDVFELVDDSNSDVDVTVDNLISRMAELDSTHTLNIGDSDDDTTVVIRGNLTVNGTTTTLDAQNLVVEDKNIVLGDPTAAYASDALAVAGATGGGITIVSDTSGSEGDYAAIMWNNNQLTGWELVDANSVAESAGTKHPIAVMDFSTATPVSATDGTEDTGAGVGSFWYETDAKDLYIRID